MEKREKELMGFYLSGKVEFEEYSNMIKMVVSSKRAILEQLASIPDENIEKEITIRREDIIDSFKANWLYLSNTEKHQFLLENIKRIDIVNERQENSRFGKILIKNIKFYDEK